MSGGNDYIEILASSLVREYLSRKGLKSTLQSMDGEMPRTVDSISNRAALAKEAHLEKLLKKNKENSEPLRTMIEILVKYHLERTVGKKDGAPQQHSSSHISDGGSTSQTESRRHKASSKTVSDDSYWKTEDLGGLPQEDKSSKRNSKENSPFVIDLQQQQPSVSNEFIQRTGNSSYSNRQKETYRMETSFSPEFSSKVKSKSPQNFSRSRGMAGPITSSIQDRQHKGVSRPSSKMTSNDFSSLGLSSSGSLSNSTEPKSKNMNKLRDFGFDIKIDGEEEGTGQSKSSLTQEPDLLSDVYHAKSGAQDKTHIGKKNHLDEDISRKKEENMKHDMNGTHPKGTGSSREAKRGVSEAPGIRQKATGDRRSSVNKDSDKVFGDLKMDDIDDSDESVNNLQLGPSFKKTQKYVDARPLSLRKAVELKTLIFGNASSNFNKEWLCQGFPFNNNPGLEFGIVQHKGGPCGVLASVQSFVLMKMLYSENRTLTPEVLRPDKHVRSQALAKALAHILWKAGDKKRVIVTLPSLKPQYSSGGRCKADGVTEYLILYHFTSLPDVEDYVLENIGVFENSEGPGCVLLLYSLILTKTIEKIIEEMDEPSNHLMGAHSYCSQEMVNLILTGRAVSNVHNDIIEADMGGAEKTILRGLNGRNEVGLLSLFEHYGSCEVGSYYKTPLYPIWVVCSESHFSILFSLKKSLLSDWRAERRFDLYFYDGLAKQEEEIRLTIDTVSSNPPSSEDDLIPPLELCIRTKWPDAVVDWNGSEPLL